ncbi:hypothetical protein H6CHR_03047 [Variovorax sp. PBL-H6]|uniref:hypothetical protein n=1 Tax=Variovorax sp. PBL-H6 TaxID=434009 RepID=UPI001319B618|nr:hypothetical protein [Variovorax sp. PBL-H6]VTU28715.1 hypothetical protein H6CHR_03047 [Variovorax sp. PBL-H6]
MTDTQSEPAKQPSRWRRPDIEEVGPNRAAGGFYRTGTSVKGTPRSGVPLSTANAAVVAAVRLAYEVAETQVARSTRMATRLRTAADEQVGEGSGAHALDAAERLVMKSFVSGLEWWESSVAEGRCPVKRLAAAEYQMLGTLLGLGPAAKRKEADERGAAAAERASTENVARPGRTAKQKLQVVHTAGARERRRVAIDDWELTCASSLQGKVYFYCADHGVTDPIEAEVVSEAYGKNARLTIQTPPQAAAGQWQCVICDDDGLQVGHIEITL